MVLLSRVSLTVVTVSMWLASASASNSEDPAPVPLLNLNNDNYVEAYYKGPGRAAACDITPALVSQCQGRGFRPRNTFLLTRRSK
jgi:hypothetical protein